MLSVLGFLVILAPLVIVHELGHFLFARLFNVKAEVFSIGFGPALWKRKCGETELRFSAIPLGGYVKLLGEDRETEISPQEQHRSVNRQAPWKRFFIFFGGPFFNFLYAIFVFMIIFIIGEPQLANFIGRVVHESPAAKMGFQSGDQVLAIDGNPIKRFDELIRSINENPGKPLAFSVLHKGAAAPVILNITPEPKLGISEYGESTNLGEIEGLLLNGRTTAIGVSDPSSDAGKAGLGTGDQVIAVNETPVNSWEEVENYYNSTHPKTTMLFKIYSLDVQTTREISFTKKDATAGMGQSWGLFSSELFVEKVIPDSPAEKNGIKAGDRLIGVGNTEVQSFFQLKDEIQQTGEKDGKVLLKWERDGKSYSADIEPTSTVVRDYTLKKKNQFTVGVVPKLMPTEPAVVFERVWNPFTLLFKATEKMVTFIWRNVVSIQKLITGDVSVSTLGGPILIGKIAGESLSRGLRAFLSMMAILSIGLGVLNILPIPILDGGHLLLLGIEIIRGKPLNLRTMEIIQLVGLSLILLLMIVVLRNDLARLPYF
ncbi:MAG: RIP metalloprotease RseP [Bdellovibrionota bacterium]